MDKVSPKTAEKEMYMGDKSYLQESARRHVGDKSYLQVGTHAEDLIAYHHTQQHNFERNAALEGKETPPMLHKVNTLPMKAFHHLSQQEDGFQ